MEAPRTTDAATSIDAFWNEVEGARAAVAGQSLGLVVHSRPGHPERTQGLRRLFLHMLDEYSRHNGRAVSLPEAIDGRTGD